MNKKAKMSKEFARLAKSKNDKVFDRISAMDPAGPLFFNDIPYPFHGLNLTSASRLNPKDAKLVDVIHTDGNPRSWCHVPQVSEYRPFKI